MLEISLTGSFGVVFLHEVFTCSVFHNEARRTKIGRMAHMSSAHGPEFFEHEEDHDVDLTSPVFLDDLDDEED